MWIIYVYVINVFIIGFEVEGVYFGVFVSLCGGIVGFDWDVFKCLIYWFFIIRGC